MVTAGEEKKEDLARTRTIARGEKMPFILLPIKIINIYICMIMITTLHKQ